VLLVASRRPALVLKACCVVTPRHVSLRESRTVAAVCACVAAVGGRTVARRHSRSGRRHVPRRQRQRQWLRWRRLRLWHLDRVVPHSPASLPTARSAR
jgi:hypothetical protein